MISTGSFGTPPIRQTWQAGVAMRTICLLLDRRGVIGGTSAGAAIQSQVMIAGGQGEPEMSRGFDLLPNTILDQHFLKRNRITRLTKAVQAHPSCIGMGIDEGTAFVVWDGRVEVLGHSYVLQIISTAEGLSFNSYAN